MGVEIDVWDYWMDMEIEMGYLLYVRDDSLYFSEAPLNCEENNEDEIDPDFN